MSAGCDPSFPQGDTGGVLGMKINACYSNQSHTVFRQRGMRPFVPQVGILGVEGETMSKPHKEQTYFLSIPLKNKNVQP
jgi:hypothetical protein